MIERCAETGLYVGFVPGFAGAHSQGESLDELQRNLSEVIGMLLEDGEPKLESEFIGTSASRWRRSHAQAARPQAARSLPCP